MLIFNFSLAKVKNLKYNFLYILKINPNSKAKTHDIKGNIMNLFYQLIAESKIGKMAC